MARRETGHIRCKRIYDAPDPADGRRVLVDRIWPRGVTREAAAIDEWLKEIGPSTELRSWFAHRTDRWVEFAQRYRIELTGGTSTILLQKLLDFASRAPLTLLYSARDVSHNQAVVIAEVLEEMRAGKVE